MTTLLAEAEAVATLFSQQNKYEELFRLLLLLLSFVNIYKYIIDHQPKPYIGEINQLLIIALILIVRNILSIHWI